MNKLHSKAVGWQNLKVHVNENDKNPSLSPPPPKKPSTKKLGLAGQIFVNPLFDCNFAALAAYWSNVIIQLY